MDSVRFGRALGIGARAAAKTLVSAVDAATSPNPAAAKLASAAAPTRTSGAGSATATAANNTQRTAEQVTRAAAQARQASETLGKSSKQLGRSVWSPFVKLSGVLWLEFTGVFFGIFAAYAASGAWKLRGEMYETATNHDAHIHFLMAAVMAALFAYFCVSSFMRARRRSRGK